jgi:hypothetical protein
MPSAATQSALAELVCFNPSCRARFAITDVLYNCPRCGGLIEAGYSGPRENSASLRKLFSDRRLSNAPLRRCSGPSDPRRWRSG